MKDCLRRYRTISQPLTYITLLLSLDRWVTWLEEGCVTNLEERSVASREGGMAKLEEGCVTQLKEGWMAKQEEELEEGLVVKFEEVWVTNLEEGWMT